MTATPWLTALLGGTLFRRRRQTMLGLVALASLFTAQAGCGPETSMSEGTESGTSESPTGPAISTGNAPDEVSARMFGQFHQEEDYVGLTVVAPPDDLLFWYSSTTLHIKRDGSLSLWHSGCQIFYAQQSYTWVHVGNDVLQVVPTEYNSDGTFEWFRVDVTAVTLSPGPGCDDIEEVIELLPGSGPPTYKSRYLPGKVCTEDDTPEDSKDCNFTFVGCEEGAPPACTTDAP